MVVMLRDEANRHSVTTRTDLAEGLPSAIGDRVQLQQALMDLMLNGIEGDLRPERSADHPIEAAEDNQLLISITDTGVRLPAADIDKIFPCILHNEVPRLRSGTGKYLLHYRIAWVAGSGPPRTPDEAQGFTLHCPVERR
jgi:hypothetical protein